MRRPILIYSVIAVSSALLLWYIFCLPRVLFDSPCSSVLEGGYGTFIGGNWTLEGGGGTLLGARIASDGQWRFPPSDTIPYKFAQSIITYEDKRFRYHPGVDLLAIGNAIATNSKAGEIKRGASTLTMQTIRLSRNGKPRTIGEKIIEAILATRLELRCTKGEILALYASNAPFGGNVVGLAAASWRYFGRPPEELSWAESATLAVLPNAPSLIHPGKNREKLLSKRNFLLDKLEAKGIIDSLESALAKEEPLPDKPYPMPDFAPHYLETLRKKGGDRLYRTAIDLGLQIQVQNIIDKHNALFKSNNVNNLAAIVLDVATGEALAYCGNVAPASRGRGFGESVDVIQAPRSSGSTLKPFLYAAMLDEGEILPTMLISDIPFHYKNFSPRNFNNTFDGAVPAGSVIQRSLNVPSVRMLNEYGIEKFLLLLQQLGFTTINRGADTYGLSLILGGAEITLFDLAHAYRAMAWELRCYTSGHSTTPEAFPLSPAAIWNTFEALSEVNRPEEEGEWRSFSSTRKIAWKTGTSYGNRDAWSVGVTPRYIVAVWVGNCDGEGRPNLTGVGYAAPVMFDIFSHLPRTEWFEMPEAGLEEITVCRKSGHPVSDKCEDSYTLLVPQAPKRPEVCPYHHTIHLSEDEKYIVNSDCYSVSKMKTRPWFVLPPTQEWYYMRTHSDYRQLPPYHPALMAGIHSPISGNHTPISGMEIIYPQNGMKIAAPIALDSQTRGVIFSAAHSDPDAVIFWHIDNQFIGSTSKGQHKMPITPTPGRHTLTLIDQNGIKAVVHYSG